MVVAALAGLAAAGVVFYLGVWASTPPITDADGNEVPGSIAVLEKVTPGGLEQWILIRGTNAANPVLLWLHGGPGAAQMPLAHHIDGHLEERFVVVHWDQRGAGKSNHRGFDERTMRVERYVDDARELVEHLRRRLGQCRCTSSRARTITTRRSPWFANTTRPSMRPRRRSWCSSARPTCRSLPNPRSSPMR
jgi:hypothetical protein